MPPELMSASFIVENCIHANIIVVRILSVNALVCLSCCDCLVFQNTTKPKNKCTFHFRGSSAATAYAAGMISHALREKYDLYIFLSLFMSPNRTGGGHIAFGADPVSVRIRIPVASCLHSVF